MPVYTCVRAQANARLIWRVQRRARSQQDSRHIGMAGTRRDEQRRGAVLRAAGADADRR